MLAKRGVTDPEALGVSICPPFNFSVGTRVVKSPSFDKAAINMSVDEMIIAGVMKTWDDPNSREHLAGVVTVIVAPPELDNSQVRHGTNQVQ